MFECKYKYELEDSLISAKYLYKSQKRRQDKIVAVLVPILMVCMVALLIVDIVNKKSVVMDIVLLCALVVLEVAYLIMPLMLNNSQKKSFYSQNLDKMDYLYVKIDDTVCTETLLQGENEMAKNVHTMRTLSSYFEDDARLILVFNDTQYVCLRKANLTGELDSLKTLLNKTLNKNVNGKHKK